MTDVLRADAHEWARDEAIRVFLKSRPEFVRDDPELMQALGVRPDAANVIDFGPEVGLATRPRGFATVWVIGAKSRSGS